MIDITPILNGIIAIIGAIISLFLVPLLKEKLSEAKLNRVKKIIEAAVKAAEVLFPALDGEKMGAEKLEYVHNYLSDRGITFDMYNVYDEVRVMVESAVNDLTGNHKIE